MLTSSRGGAPSPRTIPAIESFSRSNGRCKSGEGGEDTGASRESANTKEAKSIGRTISSLDIQGLEGGENPTTANEKEDRDTMMLVLQALNGIGQSMDKLIQIVEAQAQVKQSQPAIDDERSALIQKALASEERSGISVLRNGDSRHHNTEACKKETITSSSKPERGKSHWGGMPMKLIVTCMMIFVILASCIPLGKGDGSGKHASSFAKPTHYRTSNRAPAEDGDDVVTSPSWERRASYPSAANAPAVSSAAGTTRGWNDEATAGSGGDDPYYSAEKVPVEGGKDAVRVTSREVPPTARRTRGTDDEAAIAAVRLLDGDDEEVALPSSSAIDDDDEVPLHPVIAKRSPLSSLRPEQPTSTNQESSHKDSYSSDNINLLSTSQEENGVTNSPFFSPTFIARELAPDSTIKHATAIPPASSPQISPDNVHPAVTNEGIHQRKDRLILNRDSVEARQGTDDGGVELEADLYFSEWFTRQCNNDPANRPPSIVHGTNAFHSIEECCKKIFPWIEEDCIEKSLPRQIFIVSSSPPSSEPSASTPPTPSRCVDTNCADDSCDSCCTTENKCSAGEGGCNSDDDCLPGLQCARENCRSEFGWINGNKRTNCCVEYCEDGENPVYRGSTSVTVQGITCKRWDQFFYYKPEHYPNAFLEGNYCRDPEEDGTWCFTDDPDRVWGYCNLPLCPTPKPTASVAPSVMPTASVAPSVMPSNAPSASFMPTLPPTTSADPTVSFMPTTTPCDDANCASGCYFCCTAKNKCSIGEGDCDHDDDCASGLVCGHNNCRSEFGWINGYGEEDCCTTTLCQGADPEIWECPNSLSIQQPSVCTLGDESKWSELVNNLDTGQGSLVFALKAKKNALIALGSAPVPCGKDCVRSGRQYYTVHIGLHDNTESYIELVFGREQSFVAESRGKELDENEFRKFRIIWNSSSFKVQHHLESFGWSDWMEFPFKFQKYDIEHALVWTGNGGEGVWTLGTDCPSNVSLPILLDPSSTSSNSQDLSPTKQTCEGADPEVCGCSTANKVDYRGPISNTKTGFKCQYWEDIEPHNHTYTPDNYPESGLEGNNACRNPDNDPRGPWCFTVDKEIEWGYCRIPACSPLGKIDVSNNTLTNIGDTNWTEVESNPGKWIISHTGKNWASSYLHSPLGVGDFVKTIFVERMSSSVDDYAMAGLMIRETLQLGSAYTFLHVGKDGQIGWRSRHRTEDSGTLEGPGKNVFFNDDKKLERGELRLRKFGNIITGYARAANRREWTRIRSEKINFVNFHLGIAVSSHPKATCGKGKRGDGYCGDSRCCSQYGWCGKGEDYCSGTDDGPSNNITFEFSHVDTLSWLDSTETSINGYDLTLTNLGSAYGGNTEVIPDSSLYTDNNSWTLVSASNDIGDEADDLSYLHSFQEESDFSLTIFIENFADKSSSAGAKAGLMIRENLHPGSRLLFLYVGGSGQIGLLMRDSTGQLTNEHNEDSMFTVNGVDSLYSEEFQRGELRLRKNGNAVTGYARAEAQNKWISISPIQVGFESFYVGIALAPQSPNIATLEFSHFDALTWFNTPVSDTLNELRSFYIATGGVSWTNRTGWLKSETFCSWFGVTCNDNGDITEINLSNNNLSGHLAPSPTSYYYGLGLDSLRHLKYFDLSRNSLSGEADILLAPVARSFNLSCNQFTSIGGSIKSKSSYETLEILDLSHNKVQQDASDILSIIPPNLKVLLLSNNMIIGPLPDPFPVHQNLEQFLMEDNKLVGQMPNRMHLALPVLKDISLANQALSGTIPTDLFAMPQLKSLNLSNNQLTGSMPAVLGGSKLFSLDLSSNDLEDLIPSTLSGIQGLVLLTGNPRLENPAPLNLCLMRGFDQANNTKACPPERNALREIYVSAKGTEWTDATNWLDEHKHHCTWFGVNCDPTTNTSTVELVLANNGLSGKLSKRIADLTSLSKLDMSDNDIKGTIPEEIGLLLNLTYLRLSYNSFIDTVPSELRKLHHLSLFHLHGNRLQGEMPHIDTRFMNERSSFITDCGVPTDFEEPLICKNCKVCCNVNSECHFNDQTWIKRAGFSSYVDFSWAFCLCLVVLFGLLVVLSNLYDRAKSGFNANRYTLRSMRTLRGRLSRRALTSRDKKYALSTVGTDSVYSFFLSTSLPAWIIVFLVLGLQIWMLFEFIRASELDFSDDTSEFVYAWKCPRNSEICLKESDEDWKGWVIFAIVMLSHQLSDFLSGIKLLILAGKQRNSRNKKLRRFIGGSSLCFISALTVYASTVYNIAIARSNPDIIVNSIIILFITDIDEKIYTLVRVINQGWVKNLEAEQNAQPAVITDTGVEARSKDDGTLEDDVNDLKEQVARLEKLLVGQNKTENESILLCQDLNDIESDSAKSHKSFSSEKDGQSSNSLSDHSNNGGDSNGSQKRKRRGRRNLRMSQK